MRWLVIPEMVAFAEHDGRVIGAAVALLDFNPILREIDDVLFNRYGWYVGASGGFAESDASSSGLRDDLRRRNHDVDVFRFDDGDFGGKLYVGYRFESPFALELGVTGIEGSESTASTELLPGQMIC